jgi:hypothetical protein
MLVDDMLIGLILCGLVLAVAHIRADLRQSLRLKSRSSGV